jgi:glycosyltransferase involved in cell wall biosynthesis
MNPGKYEINIIWGASNNAAHKAPVDADEIYRKNGFKVIRTPNIPMLEKLHTGIIYRIIFILSLIFRIRQNSEIHIQLTGLRKTRFLINYIRFRARKIVLLIHDVSFLRYAELKAEDDISLYNKADEIIVHSDAMATALKENGANVPMKILNLFDYLTTAEKLYEDPNIHSIVFAGNLHKSKFIKPLMEATENRNISIYFYGDGKLPEMEKYPHIHYEGSFSPNDISQIKGAWGLVWDGSNLTNCDPYLKYNAPHKLSLYLASGKPLIIWRHAALSEFIVNNKLGILIDSVLEIPDRLSRITEKEYMEYKENTMLVGRKLRNGDFLSSLLS